MVNQWNIVNAAFSDRIREYIKARTDLETHLAKVRTSIRPRSEFRQCLMIMLMTTIMMKHLQTANLPRLEINYGIWKKIIDIFVRASLKQNNAIKRHT